MSNSDAVLYALIFVDSKQFFQNFVSSHWSKTILKEVQRLQP